MGLKEPTPVSFFGAIRLCWLAIVDPASFDAIEKKDNKLLNSRPDFVQRYPVDAVRRSFCAALWWGISATVIGGCFGFFGGYTFGPQGTLVTVFAIAGAAILLWATLAVEGWKILTFTGGATLTERVNTWIFRGLYWIGTALLVVAASWTFGVDS